MTDELIRQLNRFFPRHGYSESDVETGLANGEIFTDKETILPFLQTALVDEKVLEVELDAIPNTHFSRLKDDLPEDEEDPDVVEELDKLNRPAEPQKTNPSGGNNEPPEAEEDSYQQGDYLMAKDHLVILPLEPGLGNLHLRHSNFIVLRMFINTHAVEFVTTFEALAKVGDLPVLRLSFPLLARKIFNIREFRAKVPDSLNFVADIEIDEDLPVEETSPVDISIKGMAFAVSKQQQKNFILGATHSLKLYLNDELLVMLNGQIRHLSKVRKKRSIEYVCGIEFDLSTKTLCAVIESIVTSVQRAHLKELAAKSDAMGINLIS